MTTTTFARVFASALYVSFTCIGISGAPETAQEPSNTAKTSAPTVLFMCPHGAAKSVLASAYFQRAANERGLNVRVVSAGTDPDPEVAPAVANHLKKGGYDVPVSKPRRATADDMAKADVVISIGCDLKDLPAPRGTVKKWDDVPSPSQDFNGADASIRKHVAELVDELVRLQRKR